MTLPQIYLLLHILFMIGIIVLCMVAAMPTRYWMQVAAWIRRGLMRSKGEKLQKALALQGANFSSDESFLNRGVGLAIDHKHDLIFLAQPDGQRYQTAILPKSHLGAHTAIIRQQDGFHHSFVEIFETGTLMRKWLLPCADFDLAEEVNGRLNEILSGTGGNI